jgi:glutathione S-transferase
MPTLYGVNASPYVRKTRVFLAEKNLPYDLEPVIPINVSDEYKKISPLGKIPTYKDGDKILNDSSVICAYLERVHPNPPLYPSDPYEYARALWFEEYADGGFSQAVTKVFFPKVVAPLFFNQPADDAAIQKIADEELPRFYDYLESQIGGKDTLVGNKFTIGDIAVGSFFVNLRHAGYRPDPKRWPNLARYVDKVHARPSFKAVIEEEAQQFGAAS